MKREIITTEDGSSSLRIPEWQEQYHSNRGAMQESLYVFIHYGLHHFKEHQDTLHLMEFGFGTGLNALITLLAGEKLPFDIHYYSLEKYPLTEEEIKALNYPSVLPDDLQCTDSQAIFNDIHLAEWGKEVEIRPGFFLTKLEEDFKDLAKLKLPLMDLVYFDAFGARVQPNLWEPTIFELVAQQMKKDSAFTTYACKGIMLRTLRGLGMEVIKVPGPPGKRQMTNAFKGNKLHKKKY